MCMTYVISCFDGSEVEAIIPTKTFSEIKNGTKKCFLTFIDLEGFEMFIAKQEIKNIQRKVTHDLANGIRKGDDGIEPTY